MKIVCGNCHSDNIVEVAGADKFRCDDCGKMMTIVVSGAVVRGPRIAPKPHDPNTPFVTLSLRMLRSQRDDVVLPALEAMRDERGMVGRSWKGTSLEYICADFLAGNRMGPPACYASIERTKLPVPDPSCPGNGACAFWPSCVNPARKAEDE
jgi:hypothetical protein